MTPPPVTEPPPPREPPAPRGTKLPESKGAPHRPIAWRWAILAGLPTALAVALCLTWRFGVLPAIAMGEAPMQMKMILLAARMYAEKGDRWFPAADGAAGLQQLRAPGLLPDARAYTIRPGFPPARAAAPLAEHNASYRYFGGCGLDSPADAIILCEKPGLRRGGGLVGLADGRVAWLPPDAWERFSAALAQGRRPGRKADWCGQDPGTTPGP